MFPACPAPSPAEATQAPLRTLISMTTWEDSPAGGGEREAPRINHRQSLPQGPLWRQRSRSPTLTSVASN